MNKVIILEGPDNIGKTTLIDDIRTVVDGKPIIRHWGPNKNKIEGKKVMDAFIYDLRMSDNKIFICDRSPFGEFVYGTLFRGYDPWTYFENIIDDINRLKTKFLFISFYADENTYDNLKIPVKSDEKKDEQKRHMSKEISEDFINLTHRLRYVNKMDRLVVNCNNYQSFDARNAYVIDNVIAFLKNSVYEMNNPKGFEATVFNPLQNFWNGEFVGKKYKCNSFENASCILGKQHVNDSGYKGIWENPCSSSGNTFMPRVVFVGEAPGNYNEYKHSLPFYGDRSGDIFHNALRTLRLLPTEIYVTNTIHCSPKNHSLGKYSETRERLKLECVIHLSKEIGYVHAPIIALGRVADKTLDALRIKHKFIYHPSYYARIGKPEKFVDDLHKTFAECKCII
jgi:uracil-DNA glycosylase family 4